MREVSMRGNASRRLIEKFSPRSVLRAGYAVVLILLILSAFDAYRIQRRVSEQSIETYRNYIQQDNLISQIRRSIWLGSGGARDFLMNPGHDRHELFRTNLKEWRATAGQALDQLEEVTDARQSYIELRRRIDAFFATLDTVAASSMEVSSPAAYEFVQREVVPRRSAASAALQELTRAHQETLRHGESRFAASQGSAAKRLLMVLGACLITGVLVAWFSLRHAAKLEQDLWRHYEEVEQTKRNLEQLSARLLEVQETERASLSRELHDEVGQSLTALRIDVSQALALARDPEAREHLESARQLAERVVRTVRNISLLLRPSLLDDLGLAPALQAHIEEFSRRSGIAAELNDARLPENLPDAINTCVYRVVQEALVNCEKHSFATHVRVTLDPSRPELAVTVEDNGCGFRLDSGGLPSDSGGLGILGMRERAGIAGGTLLIQSSPGAGTRLRLTVPLTGPLVLPEPAPVQATA